MAEEKFFETTNAEMARLAEIDPPLGRYIARRGAVRRKMFESPFFGVVDCIVSQQIAGAVADKIVARLGERLGSIAPETVFNAQVDALRECGISERKAAAIFAVAQMAVSGGLDFDSLGALPSREFERRLLSVSGIGVWTVEMLRIFAFAQRDVFSPADFGIRVGFAMIHPRADIKKYRNFYGDCATAASLYYWEAAADPAFAERRARFLLKSRKK